MPTLGRFVKRRRIELGLTQEDLAERMGEGVRQADISRLENDRVTLPRRDRLERLAEALDVPLGVLLARSGWTGADEGMAATLIAASSATADAGVSSEQVPEMIEILNQVKALVGQVETLIEESTGPGTVVPVDDVVGN